MTRQHRIPEPPPIREGMTQFSSGADAYELVGRTVVTAYQIPDSDRYETLLLLDNGKTVCLSCDPIVHDDEGVKLPPEEWGAKGWECCMYDATETPAGEAMLRLAPGQWL